MRAICQLLPTLLVGILGAKQADGSWRACDPNADYLTDTFCAYVHYLMELKRYNRPPGHTERTLQQLRHLKTRFIGLVRQHSWMIKLAALLSPRHTKVSANTCQRASGSWASSSGSPPSGARIA
jgi:hypothetical protein